MSDDKQVSYEVSPRFEAVKLPPVTAVILIAKRLTKRIPTATLL